jgi:hypothetical protein
MAKHREVAYSTAGGTDDVAQQQSIESFITPMKHGSAAVTTILALQAMFLT